MVGWILRIIGFIGLLYNELYEGAALVIVAIIFVSTLKENSSLRWIIGAVTIAIGFFILFQVHFWIGIIGFIVFAIFDLAAPTK